MRSSPFSRIAFASVFMFMVLVVGCAGPLTQLQRAEKQYQTATAEKEREAAQAAVAQAQAEAAARSEAEAGKGLATALVIDAEAKVAMAVGIEAQAEAQRDRACTLDPTMEGCKTEPPPTAAPPQAQQPAAAPPPAVQAPPPQAPPTEPFVDVRMDDFTKAGMHRLTSLPVGWEVGYDEDSGNIFLVIDGTMKYARSKPGNFKPGVCYRFLANTLVMCPAAPPPAP